MNIDFKSFVKIETATAIKLATNTLTWINEHRNRKLEELLSNIMKEDRRSWWQKLLRQSPIYLNKEQALEYSKYTDGWSPFSNYSRVMCYYTDLETLANSITLAANQSSDKFIYMNIEELSLLSQ